MPDVSGTPVDFSELRAVVFDQGGVLVDFGSNRALPFGDLERRGKEAMLRLLRETGGTIGGPADLDRLLFTPWGELYARRYETERDSPWGPHLARLRRETGAAASDRDLLAAYFEAYGAWVPALPGALEGVESLARRGLKLGVVSNVPLPGELYGERILRRLGFLPYLSSLRFSYDGPARKPSPAMLEEVLAELAVEPREALMVGDRKDTDLESARRAGVRSAWIEGDSRPGPEPDLVIAGVADLPGLL